MKVRAEELVDTLHQVEFIKSSKILSEPQKQELYKGLMSNLPLDMFCHQGKAAIKKVVVEILQKEIKDERKETPKKGTSKTSKKPKHGPEEEQLLRNPDGDTRGKSVKKRVVNKASQKRRKAAGSS
jgi:hypothetical protein